MKKNTIVQFVCFVTDLSFDDFVVKWEPYAKRLISQREIVLQEAAGVTGRNKFRYVSQHESDASDFRFAFMKGKNQDHFPEHKARVVYAGGYTPVQLQCLNSELKNDVKVIAFLDHDETELAFYKRQTYRHLNIYEAYFESCAYGHILEFFLKESDTAALLEQLKERNSVEAAVYHECPVLHS